MEIEIIPPGSLISEPDDINRVTITFPTKDDAILFFQVMREGGKAEKIKKPVFSESGRELVKGII